MTKLLHILLSTVFIYCSSCFAQNTDNSLQDYFGWYRTDANFSKESVAVNPKDLLKGGQQVIVLDELGLSGSEFDPAWVSSCAAVEYMVLAPKSSVLPNEGRQEKVDPELYKSRLEALIGWIEKQDQLKVIHVKYATQKLISALSKSTTLEAIYIEKVLDFKVGERLPVEDGDWGNLKFLRTADIEHTQLPLEMKSPLLETVICQRSNAYPDFVNTLPQIRNLHLTDVALISSEIAQLQSLEELSISSVSLKRLPQEINELVNLRWLSISWSEGKQVVPSNLDGLINLKHLCIETPELDPSNEAIFELESLDTLNFKEVAELDLSKLNMLQNLKSISILNSKIVVFPSEYFQMDNLKTVEILSNQPKIYSDILNFQLLIESTNLNDFKFYRADIDGLHCKATKKLKKIKTVTLDAHFALQSGITCVKFKDLTIIPCYERKNGVPVYYELSNEQQAGFKKKCKEFNYCVKIDPCLQEQFHQSSNEINLSISYAE